VYSRWYSNPNDPSCTTPPIATHSIDINCLPYLWTSADNFLTTITTKLIDISGELAKLLFTNKQVGNLSM